MLHLQLVQTNIVVIADRMTIGWHETSYQNLLLVPIYVTIAVTYTLTIGLTFVRLAFWTKQWHFMKKLKAVDQKMIAYVLEGFFNMLLHRENIQILNEPNEVQMQHNGSGEMGYRLIDARDRNAEDQTSEERGLSLLLKADTILSSRWAVSILSWYVATVSSLGITVFWDVFSVQEIFKCDENLDCFSNGSLLQKTNHTCYDTEGLGVTCYELSLDFPKAIAELTGILFLGANGFSFLMFVLLLVVDGVGTRSRRNVAYVIIAIVEYSCVGAILFAFAARVEFLFKERPIHIAIQEIMISAALFAGVTTPWALLLWAFSKWKGRVRKSRQHALDL